MTPECILNAVLGLLLAAGCMLALPIYWWLLVTPLVALWKWLRHRDSAGKDPAPRLPFANDG